jgi:hypothetical protein
LFFPDKGKNKGNSFDTNIMGSTNIADVDGSSLQGLEIHAMGGNKEDLSQIF